MVLKSRKISDVIASMTEIRIEDSNDQILNNLRQEILKKEEQIRLLTHEKEGLLLKYDERRLDLGAKKQSGYHG